MNPMYPLNNSQRLDENQNKLSKLYCAILLETINVNETIQIMSVKEGLIGFKSIFFKTLKYI